MNNQKHACCICGKEFTGWGNNPYGALDVSNKPVSWNNDDCCCDDCNFQFVLPGRLILSVKH